MDFWMYRLGLGILLFVIEMFVMSFDFLSLGIAAFVTALFSYMLGVDFSNRHVSGIIFLIASVVAIMISRLLVTPRVFGTDSLSPMSGESIVGKEFELMHVNGKSVIRYEGMYWNVKNPDAFSVGNKVTVLNLDDNLVTIG